MANRQQVKKTLLSGGAAGPTLASALSGLVTNLWVFDAAHSWADTGATTSASDAGIIAAVTPSIGTHILTQPGADSLKPTFRASVAAFGRSAAQFDGGDYLSKTITNGILGALPKYTIHALIATTHALGANAVPCAASSSAVTNRYIRLEYEADASPRLWISHQGDSANVFAVDANGDPSDGAAHVMTGIRSAAAAFAFNLDGVEQGTGATDPGTTTLDRFGIGGLVHTSFALGWVGYIHAIALSDDSANAAAIDEVLVNFADFA